MQSIGRDELLAPEGHRGDLARADESSCFVDPDVEPLGEFVGIEKFGHFAAFLPVVVRGQVNRWKP